MTGHDTSRKRTQPIDHEGREIDFGRTAADYDEHRPGFPPEVFEDWEKRGWIAADKNVLDLGSGTGTVPLNLAERGLNVTAADLADEMLDVARQRAKTKGLAIRFIHASAEKTNVASQSMELVTAGQCWWWFDPEATMQEVKRILKPGGRLILCSFHYIPVPDSPAYRCEEIILKHNPGWRSAGNDGLSPEQLWQLTCHRFESIQTYTYDQNISFTHERWRGRLRACNGVGASLTPEEVHQVDDEIRQMLETEFPGDINVLHRVFVATGCVSSN